MRILPLAEALGAEIRDLDAARPLSERERGELLGVWRRRHLLLIREQELGEREQIRWVENFGPVGDESLKGRGGASWVSNVRPDGFAGAGELLFHSDLAFTPEPLRVISMYAVEVPRSGTSTLFASAVRAGATLPPQLRARIGGLEARHVFDVVSQRQDLRYRLRDFPGAMHTTHPLILRHPQSGEAILFVSQMQTDCILGLPEAEGEALLQDLLAHLYRPEHVYEHRWHPGDLIVWDNWALQHARPRFDASQPRTLRRVVSGSTIVRAYEHLRPAGQA